MSHCPRHSIYNPNCHDCREVSLTHTSSILDEDDQPSAASILLVSALEDVPTVTVDDTPASPFDDGASGGAGVTGDF